jgi:putative spermidine/putrescine transport system substrate-binding protein
MAGFARAIAVCIAVAAVPTARAQVPALPTSPVVLNIVDVAGDLALTQKAIEKYRVDHPKLVSRISFTKAPAPELPAKIKAQQDAKRVDIDLVLTGIVALSAGITQKLWIKVLPQYAARFPDLDANYLAPARAMNAMAQGYAIAHVYYPSGPLLEFMPEKVKTPPTTADELLAWCKANPNRFLYARPANSGPGLGFIMGLPYILGDSDAKDPVKGWDKTWAYLKQLDSCIEYYPSGTGATMKELGEGSRDMIVTTTGWDINPRALGVVPKEAQIGALKGFHWVVDAHYMAIPDGVPQDHIAVLLDLMAYMLTPAAQAFAYDEGYFYPGPAVKDVPLSMAPAESQAALKEFGRPQYDALIADNPAETPPNAEGIVAAARLWDEKIGASKTK